MHDPDNIVVNNRFFILTLHASWDYVSTPVPKSEKYNPLRYSLVIKPLGWLRINEQGYMYIYLSSFIYKLKKWFKVYF